MIRLICKNALRNKLRTLLTVLGIAVAILSFGLLRTIISAWYAGVEASSQTRLITRNAVSLVFPLPLAYKAKIEKVPGVTGVSYGNWFGGIYIDNKNFFPQFAVEPEGYMELYPEYVLSEEERAAFFRERNSCVVGAKLARKYGWELGDSFRLTGTIFPGDWDFVIRGIYRGADETADETVMFFHWKYLDETLGGDNPARAGQVGWYVVRIASPDDASRISSAIDAQFANSLAETVTETERAFQMGFVSMTGAILTALKVISVVVVAIILLVLANTMAMTARERISEYAVLKTLGFRAKHLFVIIMGESVLIAMAGGLLGLFLMIPVCAGFARFVSETLGSFFPVFKLEGGTVALALGAAFLVGIVSGVFPASRAIQLKTADGLRRIG